MWFTNLHEKAKKGLLKDVKNLTIEKLNKLDKDGNTVWHIAVEFDGLKDIPSEFFTAEVLKTKSNNSNTVLHSAAAYRRLDDIPTHLLTVDALNQINNYGRTVWHIAAQRYRLTALPKHLLTHQILNQIDVYGTSVLKDIQQERDTQDIPAHLITDEFIAEQSDKDIAQSLKHARVNNHRNYSVFVKNNPFVDTEMLINDDRFVIHDIYENKLGFYFNDVSFVLNKNGVFLNNEKHETIADALTFIDINYTQTIPLFKSSNTEILSFTL